MGRTLWQRISELALVSGMTLCSSAANEAIALSRAHGREAVVGDHGARAGQEPFDSSDLVRMPGSRPGLCVCCC